MNDSNPHAYQEPSAQPVGERKRGLKALLLPALVLGAVAVFFWVNSKAQSSRIVWVLNGTQKPYDVTIDEQVYTLRYNEPLELRLAEGTHTVQIVPPVWGEDVSDEAAAARAAFLEQWVPAARERTFTIDSRLGLAVLDNTTFVLNPDGAAMLLESDVVYGNKNPTPHTMQPLGFFHAIESIDDAFVESPNSIETSSVSSGVVRRRLDAFAYEERMGIPGFAGEPLGDAELKAQVAARLAMDFDSPFFHFEARRWLDETEADQLALTQATPRADVSTVPPPPVVNRPSSPVSIMAPTETESAEETAPAAAAEEAAALWAGVENQLFSIALTEDISSSNSGAKVAPLVAAVEPLTKELTSDAAEQMLYLLRGQVTPSPDRLAKLETLGMPARVRMGTLLVLARNARKADATRLRDAARDLKGMVENVPPVWTEALKKPAAK